MSIMAAAVVSKPYFWILVKNISTIEELLGAFWKASAVDIMIFIVQPILVFVERRETG